LHSISVSRDRSQAHSDDQQRVAGLQRQRQTHVSTRQGSATRHNKIQPRLIHSEIDACQLPQTTQNYATEYRLANLASKHKSRGSDDIWLTTLRGTVSLNARLARQTSDRIYT
jgi:hypothetical protein